MSFKLPRGQKITYTVGEKTITLNPGTKIIQKYKVAIYCRVSSSDPDQARSLEAHIGYCRKYVAAHYQWDLVGEYADVQSGRSSVGRKQFSQMIAACMNGDIEKTLLTLIQSNDTTKKTKSTKYAPKDEIPMVA